MSRKRFVKLMMSIGWQRDEANNYARLKPDYLSYKRYWDIYCQWIKKMRYALENDSTEEFIKEYYLVTD